jgi:hypothetical protein
MRDAPDLALRAGPWCWPISDTRCERLERRLGAVPVPGLGHLPAISVNEDDDTVVAWRIAPGSRAGGTTLGPQMRQSWRAAAVALPRAVPVLWQSVRDATRQLPEITLLHGRRTTPGFVDAGAMVEGPSFGLGFCIHLASVVLGCPVPPHVVAAAAIDASGLVLPVGGLERKLAGIAALLPRVTDVLVAADQADEARRAAPAAVRVVGITRAADAIEHVFGDALSRLLVDAGSDPERREDLTAGFFRLALVGSDAIVDWAPVARGAALALDHWSDLSADARYRLDFARAVAARHCDNTGRIALPPSGWLESRPRMLRIQVVAHLVQQCADTGLPHPDRIEPLARELLAADLHEAAEPQLRLRGALARLEALTGRAQDAIAAQESLARVLAELHAYGDIAYPLSEWCRLAGALQDDASLQRAAAFHERLASTGGLEGLGARYVEFALVRGRLLLDRDDEAARGGAILLSEDVALPDHLRWAAHRWGGPACRPALMEAAGQGNVLAARNLTLVRLDDAVAAGDEDAAMALVEALAQYDPGPVGHLRRSGAAPAEVARLYPY